MNNQFSYTRATPLGPHDADRDRGPRTVSRQWLFVGVGSVVVVVVTVGAIVFGMVPSWGDGTVEPALGPSRIAFVSDRDGDEEIYVMNADGSGIEQLTDNDSDDRYPSWSPDGRIVFVSDRDNDEEIHHIYVMNADGSGVEQLTDGCSNYSPAWSPDGSRIAYGPRGDIYVMNVDGSGVEQLTGDPHDSCAAVFYSDRDGDGRVELYRRKADGSVELITDRESIDWSSADWDPSWSPDGRRIVFKSLRDGEFEVYVMNSDGSGVVRLTENDKVDWWPSWSPEGDRIRVHIKS